MLWCTELDTAENFGLSLIQKPLIAISKCPLLNIHPVLSMTFSIDNTLCTIIYCQHWTLL